MIVSYPHLETYKNSEVYKIRTNNYDNNVNLHMEQQKERA